MIEKILAQLKAIVAAAEAEERPLNEEEVEQYEGLEKELASARKSDEIQSRHAAYLTPVTDPDLVKAVNKADDVQERAFEAYLRTGQKNMDLVESRAQSEGSAAGGGYLVPTGFRQKLVERMKAFGGLESAAEVITTDSGNTIEWPTLDDTANEGEIAAEGVAGANGADLVFGTNSLGAYKYTSLGAGDLELKVSIELLQDSAFDVTDLVTKALGKRIGRKMAKDFINGSGSGEPLGILTAAADVDGTAGLAPTYGDLVSLVHGVDMDYLDGASFLASWGIAGALQALVDDNGRPLWQPANNGISSSIMQGTLLGFPLVLDNAMPATVTNDANYLIFGDLNAAYVIRHVRGVSVLVDPYTYAKEGQVGFVAFARADGTIQDPNAYAQLQGST